MKGKITIVTLALIVIGMVGFLGGYAAITKSNQPEFEENGYVLSSVNGNVERFGFEAGRSYNSRSGVSVSYRDTDGARVEVPGTSFLHYENGGMAAFTGGILVDFADLSDNFINNYYISGGLEIVPSGSGYVAHTSTRDIQLGDHLWKLSDTTYLVRSPSLKVVFSQSDMRDAADFVQVSVSDDGIVSLLTEENRWDTISEECYIQTAAGVRIYPVAQLIDNGTYKMSVAKLSVSADDAIVLTKDETRRQIVPELNITAEDGADGADGAAGAAGSAGAAGTAGSSGADGTSGNAGTNGTSGKTGTSGGAGEGGANGASGSTGSTGSAGTAGRDAVSQTTTNSALPTMTIADWQLSASALSGVIRITDEAGALAFDDGDSDKYCGTVTIYEVATGKAITCYQVNPGQPAVSGLGLEKFDDFRHGVDEVGFATLDNVLTPDTAYRLSVVAYYKMDDTIYSREFITRMFYTDSTGVFISRAAAAVDSVSVDMRVSEAYQNSVKTAEVVLLTPEQNKGFTLASTGYMQKYTLDFATGRMTLANGGTVTTLPDMPDATKITELDFRGLPANSDYVARVVVETNSGLKSLTDQELTLKTLKTPPEKIDKTAVPEANYNRVTGGFDVYRPQVKDIHGGIEEYEYTVYAADGKTVVQTRRVLPQDGEPMVFFLPSGTKYVFGVKAHFNDNEKQVVYDLGKTDAIEAVGATLPGVTFELESSTSSQEFNQIKGTIVIKLANASSKLTIDNSKPLELQIYADQVYDQKISVDNIGGAVIENPDDLDKNLYTITATQVTNETRIHVDFQKLYKNTTYTATLVGYLDLGDGNGDSIKRTIGTVSFRTKDTVGMTAQWPEGSATSSALNKLLKLVPDTSVEAARQSYALSELQEGQLTLELYGGTGASKVRIASSNITDTDVLTEIYTGSGHLITETDFGNIKLTPNHDYTLVVTSVADKTARRDDLGYVNTFDGVENRECLLVAGATPPDLMADAATGVEATPIYNADAAAYGAKKNDSLPDSALIGYRLQSTYDNVQRLAASVTYYAQEYSQFYNALVKNGTDPIGRNGSGAPMLMTMTQKAANNSNTLPAVAVLFGGTKTGNDADARYINGAYVYYAGPVQLNGANLDSGMGRGYRYVFSYTAKYSPTGQLSDEEGMSIYPYDHGDYEAAKEASGAGREHGKALGRGVAYVLNSGMCEAPRLDPTIHSYLYKVDARYMTGSITHVTEGTAEIHYAYEDTDGTIITEGAETGKTQIEWERGGITEKTPINKTPVSGAAGWYSVTIPYTVTGRTEQMLQPRLTIDRYQLDYATIMNELMAGSSSSAEDSEAFYLCFTPVEHDYKGMFHSGSYQNAVQIRVDKHEDENYIRFDLQSAGAGSSSSADELYQRAYLLQMIFTASDGSAKVGPIYLPLAQDANGPYAKIATGLLADLVGKEFKMDAAILYDTGEQGWSMADAANAQVALQFISNSHGEFGMDTYVSAVSGGQSSTPSGALGNLNIRLSEIRNAMNETSRARLTTTFTENGSGKTYYVYPGRYGIDAGSGSLRVDATGRYFVPKGVGTYSLGFADGNVAELHSMTPTVKDVEITTGSNWMSVKDTFSISGITQADQESSKYVVHVRVYDTEEAAKGLYTRDKGSVDIEVDTTGKPIPNAAGYTINGLAQGQSYWYVLSMKVKGKETVLMDGSTALTAVYPFQTIDGVTIASSGGILYNNTGYYAKTLTMGYTVSSYVNLKATYDIFATSDEAVKADGVPLYSHAYLSANGFYNAPAPDGFDLGRGINNLQINLKPRPERDKLTPGGTYYLKVTVHDKDGSAIGSNVWPFSITATNNYGAYVYAPQATKNSVRFQVTLNDPQYLLMAPDSGAAGSFVVRFAKVDASGNMKRLLTQYDDMVFDAATPKQNFELNDSTLLAGSALGQIEAEATYKLLIYAVPDPDHDGLTDQHNAEWFLSNNGQNLQNTLNGFWNADYSKKNDTATQNAERLFLIAEKTQKTTSETGLLVSDKYTLTRDSASRLKLTLSESYGVVQEDGTQSFQKIAWSVDGRSNSNEPFNRNGVATKSNRDDLFVAAKDGAGYDVYIYTIPTDVPAGSYQVVIQLYTTESDFSPYKTLSIWYEN